VPSVVAFQTRLVIAAADLRVRLSPKDPTAVEHGTEGAPGVVVVSSPYKHLEGGCATDEALRGSYRPTPHLGRYVGGLPR